jgi:hypothetical protein
MYLAKASVKPSRFAVELAADMLLIDDRDGIRSSRRTLAC